MLALSVTSPDTMQAPGSFDEAKALDALRAGIAGKEDDPADQVFQNVKVLGSVPLLDRAAIEAVQQWRYTPTRLNGVAIPVVMTVRVTFTLK